MNQLLERMRELSETIANHGDMDDDLCLYLDGEVQHLINRVQSARSISHTEHKELSARREMMKVFKLFYAYLLVRGVTE